jgi:hypothetical protein
MDTERYNAKEHRGTKGTKGTQINMHKLSPNL